MLLLLLLLIQETLTLNFGKNRVRYCWHWVYCGGGWWVGCVNSFSCQIQLVLSWVVVELGLWQKICVFILVISQWSKCRKFMPILYPTDWNWGEKKSLWSWEATLQKSKKAIIIQGDFLTALWMNWQKTFGLHATWCNSSNS